MGGSSSSSSTELPTSILTMVHVNFIDIDGRQITKEINLDWTYSVLVKILSSVYEGAENLQVKIDGKILTYNDNKTKKLQKLGFNSKSNVYVQHEQKYKSPININIYDATTGNKIAVVASPLIKYKEFCEILEGKHGLVGIKNGTKDVIFQSKILSFTHSKNKTLRKLEILNYCEVRVVDHYNGGLMQLQQ